MGHKMIDYEGDHSAVRVVISNPKTGDVLEDVTISNDFCIITVGSSHIKSWQIWGRTYQVNIGNGPRK